MGINDLPNELISWIFLLYVKTRDVGSYRISVSYQARSLLCSISHRWREIAIKTPKLWTSIEADPRFPESPPEPLIQLWVERSRTLPIYIDCYGPWEINHAHPHDTGKPTNVFAIVKLLRPELKRWKSFRASFFNGGVEAFTKLPLETAESLEELEIVSPISREPDEELFVNIAKLPALRRLRWHRYLGDSSTIALPRTAVSSFPWKQLRYINLFVRMSPDETYDFFAASTSADAIVLNLIRKPDVPVKFTPRPLVTLPNLRLLEIRSDVGIYETFQHLDLPGVKILWLYGRRFHEFDDGPYMTGKQYKEFFNRATVSAQIVILQSFDFSGDDLTEFFDNPYLLDIPVFEVTLYSDDARRAERALKDMIEARSGGTPRVLQMEKGPTGFNFYHVGWVDQEVKKKYGDGLGYGPQYATPMKLE